MPQLLPKPSNAISWELGRSAGLRFFSRLAKEFTVIVVSGFSYSAGSGRRSDIKCGSFRWPVEIKRDLRLGLNLVL